jgi:hypothetical protein
MCHGHDDDDRAFDPINDAEREAANDGVTADSIELGKSGRVGPDREKGLIDRASDQSLAAP